ncbi:hypothetical protein ACIQU1_15880 [Streptomyces angustmyceticus]|uniref:hypothetical protein n=1 Tax=Streptomyces angustmyceticus TaxID=285578 RepID=UPI00381AD563
MPVHPALVAILRDLIEEAGLKPGDLLFPGEKGGLPAGSVFRRVWRKARKAVLIEHEYSSPVGKRAYDLRHTCLTTWLNNGIPPAQVAAWAGNSVPVLLGHLHALHHRTADRTPGADRRAPAAAHRARSCEGTVEKLREVFGKTSRGAPFKTRASRTDALAAGSRSGPAEAATTRPLNSP